MHIESILLIVLLGLNIIFAAAVVFFERKDASASWAWLLVLNFIPVFGFILYLLTGQNLTRYRLFQWKERKKLGLEERIEAQLAQLQDNRTPFSNKATENSQDMIYMNLKQNGALLTEHNAVEIITDGTDKFQWLLDDIEAAQDHVHVQYYIYRGDSLGKRIRDALIRKAREGVKVRLLYDALGSRRVRNRFFKELREAGGLVEVFFPSKFSLINLRMNYRNHRKIVIIDGNLGYTGGFNVGDEYLGLNSKFGYWRDTHLRIRGNAVHALQTRFLLDWNEASKQHDTPYVPAHFPHIEGTGHTAMQIVSSGPDAETEHIKNSYLKMINDAKQSIMIQTPYFIPDASVFEAIRLACLSGIDVRIMIPNKPDHAFVYWATLSYIGELLKVGAKAFIYDNGFIHAKTLIIDSLVASVGTANIDYRSFRLNFEVNAFMYDETIATALVHTFEHDLHVSRELTLEEYQNRSLVIRFKEAISRLLSPIL
ncbi:cardiolipin synthase [Paenibacillus sp. RRE4]|uniref:cardiolipin synthase n=1 Tax=Paenibacillus sp. RRE4 TaxID=2962587 RepID=UPI00288220D7|nr:cardiolipin synthase [Paenibacillus sp. RRE4]MDT0126194.1 cardiolipin synthase [Paenibacillus sp. RRE4]